MVQRFTDLLQRDFQKCAAISILIKILRLTSIDVMLLETDFLHHQQQLSLIFVPPRDLTLVFDEEVTDQNHSNTQFFSGHVSQWLSDLSF